MKLEYVEIAGFRGFREKTRFDFPAGFVVFSGRNGAGKSTVLDAVDFVLTGTINKFSVTKAKGGGLEEHIWWVGEGRPEAHFVSLGFIDSNGRRTAVTRSRDRGLHDDTSLISRLCGGKGTAVSGTNVDTLMQTSLIRDESIVALSVDLPEQARFAAVRAAIGGLVGPDHSQRTSAILKAATAVKDEQQKRVEAAQAQLGQTLTAITEARSAAERSPDVSGALGTIASFEITLPTDAGARTETLRSFIAGRKAALHEIEEWRKTSEELIPEIQNLSSKETRDALASLKSELENAFQQKKIADDALALAISADTTQRESDVYAAHLSALLEHGHALGLQDGYCPLCAAPRLPEEFEDALARAQARLATRGERMVAAAQAVTDARAGCDHIDAIVRQNQFRLREIEEKQRAVDQVQATIQQIYSRHSFAGSPTNPSAARALLLEEQERLARLERALFILDASSAIDRLNALESRLTTLRERVDHETARLSDAEKAVESARQIDASARTAANQMLTEQFDTVMPLLQELYRRLRPHSEWIEIESDFGGKVRGSLNFTVGDGHNVQFLFSSGQRRAAGLAFLLAIHLSRRWCQWDTLLLDDPVQHIDDYRALNLVEVLAAIRRTGHQVIIAVEDSALADLLCRRLRSSIKETGRRFELGPSKSGSAEIAEIYDIYPMPREVLRPARAS
jgi:chromosome segregation protein